jgi:ribosomal protein L36
MHEEPSVPELRDRGSRHRDHVLRPGMAICIEPMVNQAGPKSGCSTMIGPSVTRDGSLSAHFEHTVAIRATGAEVMDGPVNEARSTRPAVVRERPAELDVPSGNRGRPEAHGAPRGDARALLTRLTNGDHVTVELETEAATRAASSGDPPVPRGAEPCGRIGASCDEGQDVRKEDLRQVQVIRRHGVVRVICDNKRHKQRQGEVDDAPCQRSDIPRTSARRGADLRLRIGPYLAKQLLAETKIDPGARAKDLSEEHVAQINQLIERKYVVEGQLRRQVMQNIQRLKEIKCYAACATSRDCRARPAHPHERPHAQGPAPHRGAQEVREGALGR